MNNGRFYYVGRAPPTISLDCSQIVILRERSDRRISKYDKKMV